MLISAHSVKSATLAKTGSRYISSCTESIRLSLSVLQQFFSHSRLFRIVHSLLYCLPSRVRHGKASFQATKKHLPLLSANNLDRDFSRKPPRHSYVHAEVVSQALVSAALLSETFLLLLSAFMQHSVLSVFIRPFSRSLSSSLQQNQFSSHTLRHLSARLSAGTSTQTFRSRCTQSPGFPYSVILSSQQQKEKLATSLSENSIALRQAKMKVSQQAVGTTIQTLACENLYRDDSKAIVENKCVTQLKKDLIEKGISSFQKRPARNLSNYIQLFFPLCSALP